MMSLVKKIKDFGKILMLSAGLALAATSCTTGNWQYVRTDSHYLRTETSERIEGNKKVKEKRFNIGGVSVEDDTFLIKVTESLYEQNVAIKEITETKLYQDIIVEQRDVTGYGYHSLLPVGGFIIGEIIENSGNQGHISEDITLPLIGTGIGLAIAVCIPPITISTEKRENKGITKRDFPSSWNKEEPEKMIKIYESIPAKNISFGFTGNSKNLKTNGKGEMELTDNPEGNIYATKERLRGGLYEYPLIQNINPFIREEFIKRIAENSELKNYPVGLETREKSSNPDLEKIINDLKIVNVPVYSIEDRIIFSEVVNFVKKNINTELKNLELIVKDDVTRIPINNYNLEFQTDAPNKKELVERYFSGKLSDYAIDYVEDYLINKGILTNLNFKTNLKVYSPSNFIVELTHPSYNFLKGIIQINGETNKTAYMIDKGTKIVIGKDQSSVGRIE
jgi:hypothetical protein